MDKLIRALAADGQVSVVVVSGADIVNTAIAAHDLSPTSAAALGRTMMAALLMAEELKNDGDSLTLTLFGRGSAGHVVAESFTDCTVRGYVDNPHAEAPFHANGKLNVGGVIGCDGTISVVRSDGDNLPYTGVVKLVSGEVAEDVSQYYLESEQKATAVSLGMLVSPDGKCLSAGGVLIHMLPNATEVALIAAENAAAASGNISGQMLERSAEEIMDKLFSDCQVLARRDPKFECRCSTEKIQEMLHSLPQDEISSVIKERGEIEVVCQFCNKKYKFQKV